MILIQYITDVLKKKNQYITNYMLNIQIVILFMFQLTLC